MLPPDMLTSGAIAILVLDRAVTLVRAAVGRRNGSSNGGVSPRVEQALSDIAGCLIATKAECREARVNTGKVLGKQDIIIGGIDRLERRTP